MTAPRFVVIATWPAMNEIDAFEIKTAMIGRGAAIQILKLDGDKLVAVSCTTAETARTDKARVLAAAHAVLHKTFAFDEYLRGVPVPTTRWEYAIAEQLRDGQTACLPTVVVQADGSGRVTIRALDVEIVYPPSVKT